MCGRFVAKYTPELMRRLFPELEDASFPTIKERWNAAPTQELPIIRTDASRLAGVGRPTAPRALEVALASWGLIPSWSESAKPGPINARAETVATNGLFRSAFKTRRCIVPADGFYEWQERMLAPKRPLYITRADGEPLLMAGLWERHGGEEGTDTFTVVTVAAGESMKPIHDRTPMIVEPGDEARAWLDPATPLDAVQRLIHPVADGLLHWHQVSTRVNNPRNEGPGLIEPVEGD